MTQVACASAGPARRLVGLPTTTCIVVANMVGTGVFTSLGFQLAAVESPSAVLALWVLGGIYALCGAVSYGELASVMPGSGGEYLFLSRLYHPAVGFAAGWISITVGFAAPTAAACMALGHYSSRVFPDAPPLATALLVAVTVSLVHLLSVAIRSGFQNFFTSFKVLLICVLVASGLALATPQPLDWVPGGADVAALFSAPFAVSLVYVTYSYSGWNASVYLAGEVRDPERNVPRSLLVGTLCVTALYLLLNFAFLFSTPVEVMTGQVEVGFLAASHIFGPAGGRIVGILISFGLISSISSMVWAGPRVTQALARDIHALRPLAPLDARGVPRRAVLFQLAIVLVLILTSTFEKVITYLGFTLALVTFLTVLGLFVHRRRYPEASRPARAWGYPVTPLVFLAITGWMLAFLLRFRPMECLAGLGTVLLGLVFYFLTARCPGERR